MSKAKKVTARERTAYHEAGRAVTAYILRLRFHYLTIKPDRETETAGHMLSVLNENMARWEMSDGWPDKYRARLERQAMISLAGAVAQELIASRPEWDRATSDLRTALDMLLPLNTSDASRNSL